MIKRWKLNERGLIYMTQAIIDIGSNSMRVTVYEIEGDTFHILFKEKIMAGLASYVENGILSREGIECACGGLLEFREILAALNIEHVAVFATASLRNIQNTEEVIAALKEVTGYDVEVLSGEEEAILGYSGAMKNINLESGAFVDIGGASTEVVVFANRRVLDTASFSVGSLSLYKKCVKNIVPGSGSQKRLNKVIANEMKSHKFVRVEDKLTLVGVGGTSRAVMRIAKKLYDLPSECNMLSAKQLNDLCSQLCKPDKNMIDIILKMEPSRIHTFIPGSMILQHTFQLMKADRFVVSDYGVREGYLSKRVMKNE